MNLTLSINDEVIKIARERARVLGKSVNQLVREYLEQFTGNADRAAGAEEFRRLSLEAHGDSKGWKFNREELHEGR